MSDFRGQRLKKDREPKSYMRKKTAGKERKSRRSGVKKKEKKMERNYYNE